MSKTTCTFVLGPEGSGSKYAARRVSSLLGVDGWSGSGFNCCDRGNCDRDNGFMEPCRPVAALVCHRSLPFNRNWPDIDAWRERYDCRFVLCTRDEAIARMSSRRRFGTQPAAARAESTRAARIMGDLLSSGAPCMVWSYESRDLLGEVYERGLARFLGVPPQEPPVEAFTSGNDRYRRRAPELHWIRMRRWLAERLR